MVNDKRGRHIPHAQQSVAEEHTQMILDGTKIRWHTDRVDAWQKGELVAPITIDMALTRACQYSCGFCQFIPVYFCLGLISLIYKPR